MRIVFLLILGFMSPFVSALESASFTNSACPVTTLHTRTTDGLVEGFYEHGYYFYDDVEGCTEPWQVVQVQVNVRPRDVKLHGMMYIGAMNEGGTDGAVLRPDGTWEAYQGGIHNPTAAYESLPGKVLFKVFDSRAKVPPRFNTLTPFFNRGGFRRAGPKTLCMLMGQYAQSHMELGGGYGAVQPAAQDRIDAISQIPNATIDVDHLLAAFAYNDGLAGRKYGSVFEFNCGCSQHPMQLNPDACFNP